MLKHFKVNTQRNKLIADVAFYQMDLRGVAKTAAEQTPDPDLLPSWSKFAECPAKAKGFFTYMLQAVFSGQHNADELSASIQFTNKNLPKRESPFVAMMFLPASITNENFKDAADFAQEALSGVVVFPISGDFMKGKDAEPKTIEAIEKAHSDGKSVLILAANMAQRSFSVGEITELYLAFDGGEEGATIQKMSRALTPRKEGKIGRVISLSFDPNRDDKFDAMIVQTAVNYKRNHNVKDIYQAMLDVLKTIDIFHCTDTAAIKIDADDYLKQLQARKTGLNRVFGKMADMSILDNATMIALANGSMEYYRVTAVEAAAKGKTKAPGSAPKRHSKPSDVDQKAWDKIIDKARKTIVAISENVDFLVQGTSVTSVGEALEFISEHPEYKQYAEAEFGIAYDVIEFVFNSGVINKDLLELVWRR